MEHTNQNPSSYSTQYFYNDCAGADSFICGQESKHAVFEYLFSIAPKIEGKKILDVGCGRGEMVLSTLRKGAVAAVGLDFSQDAITIAENNLSAANDIDPSKFKFICGDALDYSFQEQFDIIFLADVVEHLFEDQLIALFDNLAKALAPGGTIVIHTMPTREFLYIGQYVKWFINLVRRKPFYHLTFKSQAELTHVNLQTRSRLTRVLKKKFNYSIWYDFSYSSWGRRWIKRLGGARFFSSNLWAIVRE